MADQQDISPGWENCCDVVTCQECGTGSPAAELVDELVLGSLASKEPVLEFSKCLLAACGLALIWADFLGIFSAVKGVDGSTCSSGVGDLGIEAGGGSSRKLKLGLSELTSSSLRW